MKREAGNKRCALKGDRHQTAKQVGDWGKWAGALVCPWGNT